MKWLSPVTASGGYVHSIILRNWLALSRVRGLNCATSKLLVETFGSPESVFDACRSGPVEGISPKVHSAIAGFDDWDGVDRELDRADKAGSTLVCFDDDDYPALLREIDDPPPVLYAKGLLKTVDIPSVAVVGTRRPTHYGSEMAAKVSAGLAASGVSVISGMARGCDSHAHKGALSAGGATVAVLGTGIDRVYPPENRRLYEQIATEGLLLTEYPVGAPPVPQNFPLRNRIISGLALGVLVVEAPLRSGSLMTARLALEYNREVFSLPGPATSDRSAGTNKLIKDGAMLIDSAGDILECLGITESAAQGEAEPVRLDGDEALVYGALAEGPVQIDAIAVACGLAPHVVSTVLLGMELKGLVEQHPGKVFTIKHR